MVPKVTDLPECLPKFQLIYLLQIRAVKNSLTFHSPPSTKIPDDHDALWVTLLISVRGWSGGEAMVKEKEGEGGKWERGEEGGERRRGKEENGNNDKEENMQRQYQCKEMIA